MMLLMYLPNRMLKKSILDFFSPQGEKRDFRPASFFNHLRD